VLLQGQKVQQKRLLKSEHQVYIGYDKGSKSVKYYNAANKNILVLWNFRFLSPTESSPPEEIVIEPRSPLEEECTPLFKGKHRHPLEGPYSPSCKRELRCSTCLATQKAMLESYIRQGKRKAEDIIDPQEFKKTEHSIDYYVNNPFPDEEEASIVEVQEEAFVVIPETDPDSLKEAQESEDWPE
jgi:hypothetical protein